MSANNLWFRLNDKYRYLERYLHDTPYLNLGFIRIDCIYKEKYVALVKHRFKRLRGKRK